MQSKALAVSDHTRQIPYPSILHFYQPDVVSWEEVEQISVAPYALVIIDLMDSKKSKQIINRLRTDKPGLPVLVLLDFDLPFHTDFFTEIHGYGPVQVLDWKISYHDRLLEAVEGILHPEYPTHHTRIAVIVPVFNEESRFHHVDHFLRNLQILMDNGYRHITVYLINDGSSDDTQGLIERFAQGYLSGTNMIPQFLSYSSIVLTQNTRKAGTYIESLRQINADTFVFVDADNSFSIEDISTMLNILGKGYYDLVIGTKDHNEDRRLIRKLVSFAKRLLTKRFLPAGVNDSQTGLKVMNAVAARHLLPYLEVSTGLAIDLQMLYVAKQFHFRVLQLPVTIVDREGSHVDLWKDSIHFLKSIYRIKNSYHQMMKRSNEHGKHDESDSGPVR
ncbi:glycosyltransferase [Brevibacillus dissolubilis]|uniref:glycosyltransferase n=1 Tax=Brevibacillus dissolubilis TaxID=1844116 RepID=UPI00159B98AC|nr:glycosyltransferase [Brevibacillus dissolubilis]